ncbi:hypothetical protein G9A89_003629 [Geosiphon pyriformis]|nr:hypothetical protein G9A89_003629 [Geosiphon pyriformis]
MKKITKESGSGGGFKPVLLRKKRKSVALEEGVGSETSDIIKSERIDMEKECLIEETSFDYGKSRIIANKNYNQTPKKPGIKTKKALGKPLEKIDFSGRNNDNDDVLLDVFLELFSLLKNLVIVSIKKSFALNIDLNKVVEKSSHEKLMVIKKLFLKVNGFERAFTLSKFSEIIHAFFISKSSLAQATEKARAANILVNTIETLAEAVHTALSEFGSVILIKIQLIELWQKAITNIDKKLWDKKNQHKALCAVVCFDSAASINAVMGTTPVLKNANLHWSYLSSAKCDKHKNLGHTLLDFSVNENVFSGGSTHRLLLNDNKSRLASIYAKCSVSISYSVSFGSVLWASIVDGSLFLSLPMHNNLAISGSFSEIKSILVVSMELHDKFAALEHSLASFVEYIDKLAKRLDLSGPIISQPSPRCQPLVTLLSQNQGMDIVMKKGSGVATGGETIVEVAVFNPSVIFKIEETLNNFSIMVMGLSAKIDNTGLVFEDIVCWHVDSGNMVFIVTETKLRISWHWGGNHYEHSLVYYVSKIEKISGCLVSVWLFFKSKLSVMFLGIYASASAETRFGQAGKINSLIAKAANTSTFVVLGSNFNKNGYKKSVSFKFCLDLGLVNSFSGHSLIKAFTWGNFQDAVKIIDYIFVSESLSSALTGHKVILVSDFFDINYNAILVSVGLGGLLDAWLNGKHKQANKNKDHLSDKFLKYIDMFNDAKVTKNLDAMWGIFKEVITSLADSVFSRNWFTSAFVDNTIWVGNYLAATQHILDIASNFFLINNIAINTNKMVAIPINQEAKEVSLSISGSKISIAKKKSPTDGSIKNLGSLHAYGSAATYFPDVNASVRIKVNGLLLSTLVEIQAIALALNQALLDLCKSASDITGPDFRNKCWIEKKHIHYVIAKKGRPVFENTCHVVKKLFNTVYSVGWKARCVGSVISVDLSNYFDKARTFCVWHPNDKIRSGYTSTVLATLWLYFIKVFYHCLSVAKRKKMYNLNYPSVTCIQCGLVENSDHIFSCDYDVNIRATLLFNTTLEWNVLLNTFANENAVVNSLNEAVSFMDLYTVLAKGFVLKSWVVDTLGHY